MTELYGDFDSVPNGPEMSEMSAKLDQTLLRSTFDDKWPSANFWSHKAISNKLDSWRWSFTLDLSTFCRSFLLCSRQWLVQRSWPNSLSCCTHQFPTKTNIGTWTTMVIRNKLDWTVVELYEISGPRLGTILVIFVFPIRTEGGVDIHVESHVHWI